MRPGFPLFLLALLALLCFSAGPLEQVFHFSNSGEASLADRFLPPSPAHILGTDELGRDVFIRLLRGGQTSLGVALAAALISALIGTAVGTVAGYAGGWKDAALMRLTDFLIALPALPLLIVLAAVDAGKLGLAPSPALGIYKIVFLISLLGWTTVARLSRARARAVRAMDFTRAARALGVGDTRIMLRHVLPNILNTVIVATALSVGNIILTESALSFLGLGIQPPVPSWGNMLTGAQDNIWDHAHLALFPGLMIAATVLIFNFLGDSLQERLDPRRNRP